MEEKTAILEEPPTILVKSTVEEKVPEVKVILSEEIPPVTDTKPILMEEVQSVEGASPIIENTPIIVKKEPFIEDLSPVEPKLIEEKPTVAEEKLIEKSKLDEQLVDEVSEQKTPVFEKTPILDQTPSVVEEASVVVEPTLFTDGPSSEDILANEITQKLTIKAEIIATPEEVVPAVEEIKPAVVEEHKQAVPEAIVEDLQDPPLEDDVPVKMEVEVEQEAEVTSEVAIVENKENLIMKDEIVTDQKPEESQINVAEVTETPDFIGDGAHKEIKVEKAADEKSEIAPNAEVKIEAKVEVKNEDKESPAEVVSAVVA